MSPGGQDRASPPKSLPGHLEAGAGRVCGHRRSCPEAGHDGREFCVNATRALRRCLPKRGSSARKAAGLADRERIRDAGTPARPRPASGCPPLESAVLLDLPQASPVGERGPGMYLVRCRALRIWCWMPPRIRSLPTRIGTPPRCLPVSGCWVRMPPGAFGFIVNRPACGITPLWRMRDARLTYAGLRFRDIGCVHRLPGRLRRRGMSLMQPGGEPLRVVPDGSAYPGGWAAGRRACQAHSRGTFCGMSGWRREIGGGDPIPSSSQDFDWRGGCAAGVHVG